MKIAMIGSGAAGSVFAAYLKRGGAELYLVDRYKAHMDKIAAAGLVLREFDREYRLTGFHTSPNAGTLGIMDIVILMVKCTQTQEIMPSLMPCIGPDTVVVPTVTGLTRDEAQYRLLSAGFSVGEIRELRPEGGYPAGEAVVTAQQYLAGTRMKRGTSVGFTLAARPLPALPEIESETETEPETVGETQTEPSAPRRPGLFRWVPGTR